MLVNEEGLLYNLPWNEHASIIAGQHIVGPAILIQVSLEEQVLGSSE